MLTEKQFPTVGSERKFLALVGTNVMHGGRLSRFLARSIQFGRFSTRAEFCVVVAKLLFFFLFLVDLIGPIERGTVEPVFVGHPVLGGVRCLFCHPGMMLEFQMHRFYMMG